MDFIDELKTFSKNAERRMSSIKTEEATKMSLIAPFFQILGYDVFNPEEFMPEYTADVGIKKGEKVDYAIMKDGEPTILIECKSCTDNLDKHGSQLFRYFGTSSAKFGILTNGIIYRFFTDLEESNKMDMSAFLEINLLDLKDNLISELKKFCKSSFDTDKIFSVASELKYSNLVKEYLANEMNNPSDEFVRHVLGFVYEGQKTQKTIDKYRMVVKKAFSSFISDIVNSKITSALSDEDDTIEKDEEIQEKPKIVTTDEELQAFYIIKGIFNGMIDLSDITYRDTESYFGILFKNNNRNPICRINLNSKKKQVLIPDKNKKFARFYIESIEDIFTLKVELIQALNMYINQ